MPPRRPTVRVAVPAPPLTTALPRSFLVLTETRVFPAMMSLRTLFRRGPKSGMIWRSIRPVSVVIVEGFFGRPPFPRISPALQIGEIAGAQLLYSDRLVIKLAIFDGIITSSDPTELHLRLAAGGLGYPGSMEPNGIAT